MFIAENNFYNLNSNQPGKLFGDMSSMASFLAAAALTNKTLSQQTTNLAMSNVNFQQLAQLQHDVSMQQQQPSALAAAAAAFKYNSLYNNIQQQQQLQQNYTASLAKFMSYCQNDYMQRLMTEKCASTPLSPVVNTVSPTAHQSSRNARYHPYVKTNHKMTIITNSPTAAVVSPASSVYSPNFQQTVNSSSSLLLAIDSPQGSPKQFGDKSPFSTSSSSSSMFSPANKCINNKHNKY